MRTTDWRCQQRCQIRIWFLEEACPQSTLEDWQWRQRLRATRSISAIQKPERSGHRLRNPWRSGPPSEATVWYLLTVEPADWEDQLHGQKVQDRPLITVICRKLPLLHCAIAASDVQWMTVNLILFLRCVNVTAHAIHFTTDMWCVRRCLLQVYN